MNDENTNPKDELANARDLINQAADETTSDPASDSTAIDPDEETKNRIRNLGYVGTALMQSSASESSYLTNYFLAKESLVNFKEGIDKLNLDAASKKGMNDLVQYLQKKIDKRMKNAETPGNTPMI